VSDHDYLNGISYALVILLRPRCAFTATHVKAGNPARTKRCDNQNGNNQNGDNQSARIDLRARDGSRRGWMIAGEPIEILKNRIAEAVFERSFRSAREGLTRPRGR